MAQTKPKEPPLQNISLSLKAKLANKNMAANPPIQNPTPSKPGL
jgi:hypothetical protein